MSDFIPPRFTLASGLESEIEWVYHNKTPRAIMAIRTPEDPALTITPKVKSDEGEEIAVVSWIDPAPDEAAIKKLLKEALDFVEEIAAAYQDEDYDEEE